MEIQQRAWKPTGPGRQGNRDQRKGKHHPPKHTGCGESRASRGAVAINTDAEKDLKSAPCTSQGTGTRADNPELAEGRGNKDGAEINELGGRKNTPMHFLKLKTRKCSQRSQPSTCGTTRRVPSARIPRLTTDTPPPEHPKGPAAPAPCFRLCCSYRQPEDTLRAWPPRKQGGLREINSACWVYGPKGAQTEGRVS